MAVSTKQLWGEFIRTYRLTWRLAGRHRCEDVRSSYRSDLKSLVDSYRSGGSGSSSGSSVSSSSPSDDSMNLNMHLLIRDLQVRASFLRTVTPRRPGDRDILKDNHSGEGGRVVTGKYVLREGQLVEISEDVQALGKGNRAANGMPASLEEAKQIHNKLLRRQHYGRTPPPPTMSDYLGF
ncbi:hypothetical protein PPROV_000395600 [Pycnococcus provasolii]|uniref:Uncharacterized protein n=1 Tax=Pycnococcus provasolii TaxID=41880 RepID=A0A830HDR9_9CHLO|nr:hypothetical protein PPROV_000395600 [Pycnococcus provasolii]|mmetsp:Transcript_5163/g.11520  ORF Transcript_5163/g.11520 Transcript_5163/m.11520 type:complete len:180 (+) Transcript_5163:54-593(+)